MSLVMFGPIQMDAYDEKFLSNRGAEPGSENEVKVLKELASLVDCHINTRAPIPTTEETRKRLAQANRDLSWQRMMEVCACAGNGKTDLSVGLAEKMAKIAMTRE